MLNSHSHKEFSSQDTGGSIWVLSINPLHDKLCFFLCSNWSYHLLFTVSWSCSWWVKSLQTVALGVLLLLLLKCAIVAFALWNCFCLWLDKWNTLSGGGGDAQGSVFRSQLPPYTPAASRAMCRSQPVNITFCRQTGLGCAVADEKQVTLNIISQYLFHFSSHVPLLYGDLI